MLFSSISFLYYFLPCVLFLYLIVPRTWKNVVLLLSSLFFYAWGEPYYVLYMLGSILIGYLSGLMIEKWQHTLSKSRAVLFGSVGLHIAVLFSFKISDTLPIGISFYTFQVVSYIVDVYRQDVKAQKSIVAFAAYVSMFPQLIAGPIVRYVDIERQLTSREHSFSKAAQGVRRFVFGLSKKVILANSLGELCNIFAASQDKSVLYYWMYAVAFSLHIYFDFSGYSDMAIGLGKIMGFDYLENFNYPYISGNVTEFWRRWHISLGSWFRDYVYIPLGGNRVKRGRYLFNIFLVWALTGLWHGGAWNFVIWGLYFAALLMIEKMWLLERFERHAHVWFMVFLKHIYLLLVVLVGFVIFNAASMQEALHYLSAMFGMGQISLVSLEAVYYLESYAVIFGLAILGATPFLKNVVTHFRDKCMQKKLPCILWGIMEAIVLVVLLATATAFLVDGSYNPFLYFRF